MKRRKIILSIAIQVTALLIGYFIGYKSAHYNPESYYQKMLDTTHTFQAVICDIHTSSFLVEGIKTNDINYRGKFDLFISDETQLKWHSTDISFSDFDAGDYVNVTFTGSVAESYPAQISDVIRIELLDDEL